MQHVEWNVYECAHEKETQVRKFIDGVVTTQISHRFKWRKHGRFGAYEKALKAIGTPPQTIYFR